jgi:hypothetical protein
MFIVWGKTIKRQKLGFVADYCAVCRDLRTFRVNRIGSASHVYYISFGEGELVGYERICQDCTSPFEAATDTYRGMSPKNRPPAELLTETFPNYYTAYREQLERNKKLRDAPSQLTSAERRDAIRDPFEVLAPLVQQKLSSVQVDGPVWLALAAFVPVIWLFISAGKLFDTSEYGDTDPRWAIAGTVLGLGLIVWQLSGSARRYVSKKCVPWLAGSLATLRPTERELIDVLEDQKRRGGKMAKKLRPADVRAAIEHSRHAV